MEQTIHYANDRGSRYDFVASTIGLGKPLRSFHIDRGHPNGPEIHTVTDTAIILIQNERTKKLVTLLIARPGQIARLYESVGETAPAELTRLAHQHMLAGYNLL